MQFDGDFALSAGTVIASAGVAFGVVKGKLSSFITHTEHAELCKTERAETNKNVSELFKNQREMHGMIKEIHGYLKAQNGGDL